MATLPTCALTPGSASTQPSPEPSACAVAVTPAGLATSETAATLEALHGGRRRCSEETAEHLRFLETLPGFVGELPVVFIPCFACTHAVSCHLSAALG